MALKVGKEPEPCSFRTLAKEFDELYVLTEDMMEYYGKTLKKAKYKPYFVSITDSNSSKAKIYAEKNSTNII